VAAGLYVLFKALGVINYANRLSKGKLNCTALYQLVKLDDIPRNGPGYLG